MAEEGEQKSGFGFKIAGKARPKVAVNVEEKKEQRQLITGVAGSVIQAAEPAAAEKQYVIPALHNTYKTGVGKFVPTFVPESTTQAVTGTAEDRYERAAVPDQPSITSFGLEVRQRRGGGGGPDDDAAAAAAAADAGGAAGPLVAAGQRGDDAAKFRADLAALPEEAGVEAYESLPVEEFGRALLRGLGWADGQGVGRSRQLVEPKQIIKRPDRLGLGANPAAPPPDRRPRKMGDKPRQDLVAAPTADGVARHRVGLDEVLVPRSALAPGPQPGKLMRVVAGDHHGMAARVLELLEQPDSAAGLQRVRVELLPSGVEVTVSADELADKGSTAAAAAAAGGGGGGNDRQQQRQQREGSREAAAAGDGSRGRGADGGRSSRDKQRDRSRDRDRDRGRGRDRSRSRDRERDRSGQQQRSSRDGERDRDRQRQQQQRQQQRQQRGASPSSSSDEDDRRSQQQQQQQQGRRGGGAAAAAAAVALPPHKLWVASLIRVRVIDKRLQGGRLYLKKGTVLDVAPDGTCDVRLEEGGRQVISAHQDQLETVVPKEAGGAVMVVAGPHRGRKGRLLQVSISGGAAALQLTGDMEVVRLLLDDVAQFMGHLDEEDG